MSRPTLEELYGLHTEAHAAHELAQQWTRREPYHGSGLAESPEYVKWKGQNAIAQGKFKDVAKRLSDAYSRAGYRPPSKQLDGSAFDAASALEEIGKRLAAEASLAGPRGGGVSMSRNVDAVTDADQVATWRREAEAWRDRELRQRHLIP